MPPQPPLTGGLDSIATPGRRDLKPFFIACCIFLIVMELIGGYSNQKFIGTRDFRNFYAAGYMVRTQPSHLYDLALQKQVQDALILPFPTALPYVHPSYEALVYAPFTFLPYRAAYLAFTAFDVLLLIAIFFVARPLFSKRIDFIESRPGLIFFLFFPVILATWQGQDSILFLLLCCLTWRQLESGKDLSAGCILALALFRFQLAIPIAVLIAVRRNWRFSAGFLGSAAAVILLSVALVGRAGSMQLVHLLSAVSLSTDHSAAAQEALAMHPHAMPNLYGLLFAFGTLHLSANQTSVATTLVSAAVFLWCLYRAYREPSDSVAFAIAILCSVLVSYHLYMHDATLLLLPIALLADHKHRYFLLAFYSLPVFLFFSGDPGYMYLLAIPMLMLLFYALTSKNRPSRISSDASMPTPLYT